MPRFYPNPRLNITVMEAGDLLIELSGEEYVYPPEVTAMWIALRQHQGDVAEAAETLSGIWMTDRARTRQSISQWAEAWCRDGILMRS